MNAGVAHYLLDEGPVPEFGSAAWVITATPLRIFFAGDEAVFVFFVLSGLVLTLPLIRQTGFDWMRYFPSRVFRLYAPTAVSLLLAMVIIRAFPRVPAESGSSWLNEPYNPLRPGLDALLNNLDLLFGNAFVNGPIWSLKWEMLFSLALPLVAALLVPLSRRWVSVLVLCGLLVTAGLRFSVPALVYLPIFLIGVVLATRLEHLRRSYDHARERWPGRSRVVIGLLFAIAIAGFGSYVALRTVIDPHGAVAVLCRVASIYASGLLVALCAITRTASVLLGSGFAQWLGSISFSLYLVHQPIIATLGYALGPERWYLAAFAGLVLSLAAALLFRDLVERPSHVLAQRIGERASGPGRSVLARG